jgi:glutaminyl-tRNA synthetase
MEFENNRELYDWILDEVGFEEPRPHQYEFARREFANTVVSKRKLLRLVEEGHVRGWDDPRMPTLSGLRRRGVTPEAIRSFCDMIGVSKTENLTDIGKLEYAIRDDLNPKVPRVMCVLDPLKVVVTSYPEGQVEELDAPLYPHDVPLEGSRTVPFSRELYIERGDFRENPPKGFFRLAPGREVRLRYGYLVTCTDIVRGDQGEIVELHCTHDPESRGGNAPDGRRVRGTIHWVSAERSVPCEVRLYDRLFTARDPDAVDEGEDFLAHLNPDALVVRSGARIEPSVRLDPPGTRYQFERLGYFISDVKDSTSDRPVYNRTVTLRDNWGKRSLEAEESKPASTATRVRKDEPEDRPTGPPKPPDRTAEEEARFIRFRDGFGLRERAAHVFATDPMLGRLFEEAVKGEADEDAVAKWIVNDVLREMGDRTISETRLTPEALAELVGLVESRTLSTRLGREVLREVIARGGSPTEIGERLAADQVTDPEVVAPIIERLVVENTDKAEAFRQGQDGLLGFFIGQTMRETNGKADPKMVRRLVLEALGGTER